MSTLIDRDPVSLVLLAGSLLLAILAGATWMLLSRRFKAPQWVSLLLIPPAVSFALIAAMALPRFNPIEESLPGPPLELYVVWGGALAGAGGAMRWPRSVHLSPRRRLFQWPFFATTLCFAILGSSIVLEESLPRPQCLCTESEAVKHFVGQVEAYRHRQGGLPEADQIHADPRFSTEYERRGEDYTVSIRSGARFLGLGHEKAIIWDSRTKTWTATDSQGPSRSWTEPPLSEPKGIPQKPAPLGHHVPLPPPAPTWSPHL